MLFAADDADDHDDHDDVVDKLILTSNTPWKERASRSITDRRAECFKENVFFRMWRNILFYRGGILCFMAEIYCFAVDKFETGHLNPSN